MIAISHIKKRIISRRVVRRAMIDLLEDRFVVQLTLDVVWQWEILKPIQVALKIFHRRIERMMRIIKIDRKEPWIFRFGGCLDQIDRFLGTPGGLVVNCWYAYLNIARL